MPRSLRIAIADDEAEVRHYFADELTKGGHQIVVLASNGRELVERCLVKPPELLITDIRMDDQSGIEAMRQLAAKSPLPTILVSAHDRSEGLGSNHADQVVAFLPKPVKLPELLAAVEAAATQIP